MPRLSDILGQEQAIQVLRRATSANKLAQAYLFSGPEGVGKITTALALAAALNCHDLPGEGCLACPSCLKIQQGLHPDVIQITPDGAFIKIDQVRALERYLNYPPHEGRFRVIVLDGADQLNLYAANALLKSVEEPRPFTLFVLVTPAIHRITPTLRSRCQRIRFLPLELKAVSGVVSQYSTADRAQQQTAVALSAGSAKRAILLLESEQLTAIQKTMRRLLRASRAGTARDLFETTSEAGKDRLFLAEVLDYMRVWFRDLLLMVEGLSEGRVINADQLSQLREEAAQERTRALLRRIRAIDEAQTALRGNVNPTLVLENLVLQIH